MTPGMTPGMGGSLPCREASCGDARFRNAIPTRSIVRIDFGSSRTSSPLTAGDGVAGSRSPLLDVSEHYLAVSDHVGGINAVIDAIFADIEYVAGSSPDEATETEHLWRSEIDEPGVDAVLDIATADGTTFDLAYYEGPTGFDPLPDEAIVRGTVRLDGNDSLVDFSMEIDLDALALADPTVDATGVIALAAFPLATGLYEVQFDLHGVSYEGAPAEDSLTTYWIFEQGSYGLEYLVSSDGIDGTVYVRWDDVGGRYDHHAMYEDLEVGLVDEIVTNCWADGGRELFDAWAVLDLTATDWYAELDGEEADCHFGPVADHPDPRTQFENLPAEGEWVALEEASCNPDTDPDCI